MLQYNVKIGLAPMRRDVTPRPGIFNWEKAEERGHRMVAYIREHFTDDKVSFVDLEGINPVDVMYCDEDAQKVIDRFNAEKVDAVLIINCNFGNEEIAAQVARGVGKPVCIWAPIDDSFLPDGTRYTDSQCGIFGVSRQLQRFHIPFSFIETCAVESDTFASSFARFVSVSCMVKNFRGMRIAQVGMRPKPFCSVIFNEGELMEKFGLSIIPVNMAVIIDKYQQILRERDAELEEGAKLLASRYEMDDLTPPLLKKVYAFVPLFNGCLNLSRSGRERRVLDGHAAGCGRDALHGIQHSGRYGLHYRLRKRSARHHHHGAAFLCHPGTEGSLLRGVYRAPSGKQKCRTALALRSVCLQPEERRLPLQERQHAPVVPGSGRTVHRRTL